MLNGLSSQSWLDSQNAKSNDVGVLTADYFGTVGMGVHRTLDLVRSPLRREEYENLEHNNCLAAAHVAQKNL